MALGPGRCPRSLAQKLSRQRTPVRGIVTLTRAYVLGGGMTLTSACRDIQRFAAAFTAHPQSRLDRRYGPMCDELIRGGELFPVLFTNPVDGMSYLRFVPATRSSTSKPTPKTTKPNTATLRP